MTTKEQEKLVRFLKHNIGRTIVFDFGNINGIPYKRTRNTKGCIIEQGLDGDYFIYNHKDKWGTASKAIVNVYVAFK